MENTEANLCVPNPEESFVLNSSVFDWEKKILNQETVEAVSTMEEVEATNESLADLIVCDAGSRLILSGFSKPNRTDDVVLFVNAGAEASVEADSSISFVADKFFQGGDTFQTEDVITEGGDYSFIYQSARLGDFSYRINNLPAGDYFVDLHFAEIINIYGPKGMRVFDVFIQDEKVLSEFDIYAVAGANKSLQLVDSRVSIKDHSILTLKFHGITGSPLVSGICIRKATSMSVPQVNHDYLVCKNCSTEVQFPSTQRRILRTKSTAKYEKKIQELNDLLQRKTDECFQSWMSYSAANEQLEKVRMDLDNKSFQTYSLDQTLNKQAQQLKEISGRYEHDKDFWAGAINDLREKVKVMRQEHSKLSHEAHECVDTIPDLNKMVSAVQTLLAQFEDFKMKYNEEQVKKRKLFNELQETKGNIRVFCRCRPLSKGEVASGCSMVVDFDAAKDGELGVLTGGSTKKIFKFDRVYTPRDDQVDVFADASPMATSVLDGYNVCIFAYGQTGTGKTFTMEGTEQNRGVNYRTLEELFKISKERSEIFTYNISVSVLEVYNEQIRDLLAPPSSSKKLEIKQAPEGSHRIPGIIEARVDNIKEVWNVLQAGSCARAVGSNNVNEHSSRSHCMLCIMVKSKNLINGECTKSKLWLVDLAGSERLAKTDVQGDRLKEAQNINRSLSALGDVISALANKSSHIPYRNSKLTHLLQDSLGGDSKTLMFVQISPSDMDLSETLSSLNFATRVRGVELGPVRKQVDTSELQKMKTTLEKARQEARLKDESLRKLEETLQSMENKARGKDQVYKNQLDKIKELETQLELKMTMHGQSEKQVSHLSERLKGKEEACVNLQQKVKDLENELKQQELESESRVLTLQVKVEELERKLIEQNQNSDSVVLRQKVEELERQLKEHGQNPESLILHQKIKELEEKIKEQEQQLACTIVPDSAHLVIRCTPSEGKRHSRDELMNEAENRILRSSNSVNRPVSSHASFIPKDTDCNNIVRRKRLSRNAEGENVSLDYKGRQSDPSRPISKATQRPLIHSKTSRDQVQGLKERESKKRIWSR